MPAMKRGWRLQPDPIPTPHLEFAESGLRYFDGTT